MDSQNSGMPPAILPEQFQYSVFYKLGAIEAQLNALNSTLTKHVVQTEEQNKIYEKRLSSLELWRTQVNARAGAIGGFVGTIGSLLVIFADKYLLPIIGKISSGI
jgi:hypothetical protein